MEPRITCSLRSIAFCLSYLSCPLQRRFCMLCCVLQRRGVGGDLVLVFSQLHLVRGEGPAAVRIAVHFDDRALEAEVVGHLANSQPSAGFEHQWLEARETTISKIRASGGNSHKSYIAATWRTAKRMLRIEHDELLMAHGFSKQSKQASKLQRERAAYWGSIKKSESEFLLSGPQALGSLIKAFYPHCRRTLMGHDWCPFLLPMPHSEEYEELWGMRVPSWGGHMGPKDTIG